MLLSKIIEIPLDNLRKLISEIRMKEYSRESWESWYSRTHSGKLLRLAGTAACILNEMLFGMSDQANDVFRKIFQEAGARVKEKQKGNATAFGQSCQVQYHFADEHWKMSGAEYVRQHVIDCVGTILHEYTSPEIWDLPVIHEMSPLQSLGKSGTIGKHFLHDISTLHQVMAFSLLVTSATTYRFYILFSYECFVTVLTYFIFIKTGAH